MKKILISLSIICVLILSGCTTPQSTTSSTQKAFESSAYGFSFSFPSTWEEVTRDLPQKWAILDGENTILFTVNQAPLENTLALGRMQAVRDLYPTEQEQPINPEAVAAATHIVKEATFNDRQWYTYAIHFAEQNVDSIVSGTICDGNEITVVLVSNINDFTENTLHYTNLLNSFEC